MQVLINSSTKEESLNRERLNSKGGQFKPEIDVENINPFWLLKILKIIKRISYAKLGLELGHPSRSHICDILSGRKIPKEDLKKKIAEYFGIPKEFIWKEGIYN